MRRLTLISLLILLPVTAHSFAAPPPAPPAKAKAASDPRAAQVAAATAGAILRLSDDINEQRLSPALTVRQFLEKTGQSAELMDVLRRADQIGGPRWLDDQTCQVKLSVSGQRIAKVLENIAQDLGAKSPIPAAAIRIKLRDWAGRSFLATGTSISASRLEQIRPTDSIAWQQVDDDTRRRAITSAAQDAARRATDAVRSLPVAPNRTGGDVLASASSAEQFNQWLASRPVTNVRFHDDLSVDLTLGVTSDDVFNALRDAAGDIPADSTAPPSPADQGHMSFAAGGVGGDALAEARRNFESQFQPPTGSARADSTTASATTPHSAGPARVVIPSAPPAWVKKPISAEARASSAGSRLLTMRSAELKATENLRAQVNALELAPGLTLSDAARQDPGVAQALGGALDRARVVKSDYSANGDAAVRVEIDPRDLWDELSKLP